MFSLSRNFIRVGESLYEVLRIFPEERIREADPIKEWLGATIAFRKDGLMYFCTQVDDAIIVEE